jgi:hypothetical protein
MTAKNMAVKRRSYLELTAREKIKALLKLGVPLTGGAAGTLIDDAGFTANEVYEIQATDKSEGAGAGSSFGGIGLSNQPHQQLANRTAFLKGRQDINIANIATLFAFIAKFKSALGQSGYLEIPVNDVNLGEELALIQWGSQTFSFSASDFSIPVVWPIPFSNACLWAVSSCWSDDFTTGPHRDPATALSKTQGQFFLGYTGTHDDVSYGIYWLSIGY